MTKGYFIEVNSIQIGDVFSIISTPSFFKKHEERIKYVSNKLILERLISLTEDCKTMLVHNLIAYTSDDYINIKKCNEKINFIKGLNVEKISGAYYKNAEPIVIINGSEVISCNIDGFKFEYNGLIDLRQSHNEIGSHFLITDNSRKDYKITELNDINQNFEPIYNRIDKFGLTKTKNTQIEMPQINGVCIYNYPVFENYTASRVEYILELLNERKTLDGFLSRDLIKMKTRILKKAKIINNNYLLHKLNKYFKNKYITDNVELKYLRELNKMMG